MVTIYFEGGGNSENEHRSLARKGMSGFLGSPLKNAQRPKLVACGGRDETFDAFSNHKDKKRIPLLLVDAEENPAIDLSIIEHLNKRSDKIALTQEQEHRVFLMNVTMEAWLLIDKDCLKSKFGKDFKENKYPNDSPTTFESYSKPKVFELMKDISNGKYTGDTKGKIGFELLEKTKAELVNQHNQEAKRLFDRLAELE